MTNSTQYTTEARPNLVVCYGSLLTGLGNHRVMQLADGELVGKGKLKEACDMWDLGGFPALQLGSKENGTCPVVEVYRVSDDGMKPLDRLEGHYGRGHKHNFYDCSPVEVVLENGDVVTALVYHIEREFERTVVSGDWRTHLDTRDNYPRFA